MTQLKKIVFIIPSLNGGGSERVISMLVNNVDRANFRVTLILLRKEGKYLSDINKDVNIICLQSNRIRSSFFKLYSILRNLKPDVVFSTLGSMNLLLALLKPFFWKTKFVARESSILSMNNKYERYPFLFDILYKLLYRNFDLIICQSEYMKKDMIENFNVPGKLISVINNPVDFDKINSPEASLDIAFPKNKYNLLAVGRLEKVKGYDSLLDVIALLDDRFHLTVLGEGVELASLEAQSLVLGVKERVSFLGFQPDPYSYMRRCDLMILSSRYEGFPNVLLEAGACGSASVAFDAPGGTSEIISEGINGFLVPPGDVEKMADKIKIASNTHFDSIVISNYIESLYSLKYIIPKYNTLLLQVLK